MNIKLFSIALGLALTTITINASAQKTYTHGAIAVSMPMQGAQVDAKQYFTSDSTALSFTAGPATIKVLVDSKETFIAVLVDVPVASMKKAAIYKPAEIEETQRNKIKDKHSQPPLYQMSFNGFSIKIFKT